MEKMEWINTVLNVAHEIEIDITYNILFLFFCIPADGSPSKFPQNISEYTEIMW